MKVICASFPLHARFLTKVVIWPPKARTAERAAASARELYSEACGPPARPLRRAERQRRTSALQQKRIDSIDFWRGLALAAILVNHIPGNALGILTPRNLAFSDSAELFVFLSGVSVWLCFGERFASGKGASATRALLARAFRLYGAHLALSAAALAFFGFAAALTPYDLLMAEEGGRVEPFAAPVSGVLGMLALTHQVAYFNILPLYVLLLATAPLLLFLARRDGRLLLGASVTVYAVARLGDVNLPAWPSHSGWYFNPFAWQLMFSLGILAGRALRARGIAYSAPLYGLSLTVATVGAVVVSNGLGLAPGLVDAVGLFLDWDKSALGVARVLDFLALAYACYWSGLTARLASTRLYAFFSRLGRNALETFCFGSLFSALGLSIRQALEAEMLPTLAVDVIFVIVALALLDRLACRARTRPSRQPAAPPVAVSGVLAAPSEA